MDFNSISVSAPGKLMLLGEHAVLQRKQALVAAIDKRVRVTISRRCDKLVSIRSSLGEFETSLENLEVQKPFKFVIATVKNMRHLLSTGIDIVVESDFKETIGFGSSAAVTVALCGAIRVLDCGELNLEKVFAAGVDVIREVQGVGSGADVAASVYGGLLRYRAIPQASKWLVCRRLNRRFRVRAPRLARR